MKKNNYIIILLFLLSVTVLHAQEEIKSVSKIKYSAISETGMVFSPQEYCCFQTFVNGLNINNMHSVGFGIGFGERICDFDNALLFMPLFANYRVNFLSEKRSPFINAAAGVSLTSNGANLYSGLTAGVQFYKFSISSGINMQTAGIENTLLVGIILQIGIHF